MYRVSISAMVFILLAVTFSGCASTYGEKGLRSFEDDYGISMPVSPRYKLEKLATHTYALTVHQGAPLISPGHVRAEYLSQAATVVAMDACSREEMDVVDWRITRSGDSGWVHLQGMFSCGVAKVEKERSKESGGKITTGTGFFISSKGHLITANHVVADAKNIGVFIEGEEMLTARLLKSDPVNDLALLVVDSHSVPLNLVSDGDVEKGLEVFTLGYPLLGLQGQEQKATFGRINALSGLKGDARFFQIDIPVQPGNSGGPLIDKRGDVIGVVLSRLSDIATLKATGSLPQNVNYAIKAGYVIPLASSILKEGSRQRVRKRAAKGEVSSLVKGAESSVVLILAQ